MKEIFFNNDLSEYPAIFLPEATIEFIKNGFSEKEISLFSNYQRPIKYHTLTKKINENYSFNFNKNEKHYNIYEILKIENDSRIIELENEIYYLGTIELPKKPSFHKIITIKKSFKFDALRPLLLLPIILLLFSIFSMIFIKIFIWDTKNGLIANAIITSIVFFVILYRQMAEFFKGEVIRKAILIEEEQRNRLLDEYKSKIEKIITQSNYEYFKKNEQFDKFIEINRKDFEYKIYSNNNKNININLIESKNSKRGKSELFFLEHLVEKFKKNVFTDLSPSIGYNPFQPDFIVFNEDLNLYIDIEIDEPYSLSDGETIHHDRSNDKNRNLFFNEINWGVIRFSEKQILTQPTECCKLIEDVFKSIAERKLFVQSSIITENFWTHEEALVMKYNKYRSNY